MDKAKGKRARAHLPAGGARMGGERGFTLLLAALVASIVLAFGTSIFSLVQKQLILSSIGRDSQYAFYAADSGAECALYWDQQYDFFGTSTPSSVSSPQPKCNNQSFCVEGDPLSLCTRSGEYPQTMSFKLEFNGYCAVVSVMKEVPPPTDPPPPPDSPPPIHTLIHADGYNKDCNSIANSPRVLQRTVELSFY